MRKVSRQNSIIARSGWRILAAASIAASLSLFGCTSDRIPGSGAPDRTSPGLGQSPSATPGSESNNPIPVHMSMASSMSFEAATAQVLRRVNVDALATAAANAGFRGRVLGPADPAAGSSTTGIAGVDYPTGQFINPAVLANPQYTVNSSINSVNVVPATTGDFSGGGAVIVNGATVGAVTNSSTAAISNLTAIPNQTTAAPVFLTPNAVLTPTNSAVAMPSPTAAANLPIGSVGTNTAVSTVRPANVTSSVTSATTAHPLVISQGSAGVTISNVTTAKGTTSGAPIILNVKP